MFHCLKCSVASCFDMLTLFFSIWSGYHQGFYLELRKLLKFAEDNYIDMDWLTDLLRELMEAIFFQIANREEILTVNKDFPMEQKCTNLMQV